MGLGCGGEGAHSFWGPRDSAAPPHERFSPGKFGSEARAEAAAQGEPGGCPRRGARLQRSPGRLGLRAGAAVRDTRAARLLPLSRRDRAFGLRGAGTRPAPAGRALCRSRAPGGVPRSGAGCRAFPQRLGSPGRTAGRGELPPCGSRGAPVCGAGPRAWLAVIPAAEQPEPPTASQAAAGTAGAPAAACSTVATLPACAGEVRGRFQKLGFQVTRGGNLDFCRGDLGKGS